MLASMDMVGFLLTKDYEKARSFYEGNLGFKFVSLDQFALVMQAGKSMIRIVKVPDFTPLRSTVLGWKVDDIEGMVDWLTKRGGWKQDRLVQGSGRECAERLGTPLSGAGVCITGHLNRPVRCARCSNRAGVTTSRPSV